MLERRSLQTWIFTAVAIAGSLPILFLPDLLPSGYRLRGESSVVVANTVCTILAILWAAIFATIAFRRAEEFVQERGKFAWYWGSFIGLAVVMPLAVFMVVGGFAWFGSAVAANPQFDRGFAVGAGLVLAAEMIGFAAVSLWWKATRS
ncbi:MAG: hypothetical protein ACRD5L_01290 [Bryobacteraceae bacterium]